MFMVKIDRYYSFVNERLGIADVVFRTAKFIYERYDIDKYEGFNKQNFDKVPVSNLITIKLDTSEMESPFNEMELNLIFRKTDRPKKVHGGMDRIKENVFNLYIYHNCNNIARTMTHELDHIYQVFLKKKSYKTNRDKPSLLRKSEESPTIMSIYIQLLQHGVTSKDDFIEKIQKLPKYKNYMKIIDSKESKWKDKRVADNMIRKMYKLWDLFNPENEENKK